MGAVTPIVLAAGRSTRMGRTKALLPFGDETAVSLVLAACRSGGAGAPIVVLGHDADAVSAALPAGAATCRNPAYATTGPAASLQAGLERLPAAAGALLLFPVDFPLVAGATVAALARRWEETGARVVVPSHDMRRGHPVLFDRSLEGALRALGPDEPVHRVVRAHAGEVEHVVIDDDGVLRNLDTPEDYRRCLEAWRRGRP